MKRTIKIEENNCSKIHDYNTLKMYIEKEYSKYNIQVITNKEDEINWEIILREASSDEEDISIESNDDEIIVFYSYMHWHIDKLEELDGYVDNFCEIIETIDNIIKNEDYIYMFFFDKNFKDWALTGTKNINEDVFIKKIMTNCEMPFRKNKKSIKIKQWNKQERKFKRLDNNFWEEEKNNISEVRVKVDGSVHYQCFLDRNQENEL
jgi:hypothetical protein